MLFITLRSVLLNHYSVTPTVPKFFGAVGASATSIAPNLFWPDRGSIYGVARPDPFPNSVVKRARADDSLAYVSAKVGSCRLYVKTIRKDGFFIGLCSKIAGQQP